MSLKEKPQPLRFGTSGLRGKVSQMTDLECYINVCGYIAYLKRIGPDSGGIRDGAEIFIAGDLRASTPRIMEAVGRAIADSACQIHNCGSIPSSAVCYYAMQNNSPSIMVTGSHIPDDENGIKPNKVNGEVLKEDETGIKEQVAIARKEVYKQLITPGSIFGRDSMLKNVFQLPEVDKDARESYIRRYLDAFPKNCLQDKKIVIYQHSAVGRDILAEILVGLGAEVVPVSRSDKFIPVDTEAIRSEDSQAMEGWALEHQPFALVSTDGDSDRPWLSDEKGRFLRGDLLGVLVAQFLQADFAVVPDSANDAVEKALKDKLRLEFTQIGSPYVVRAMLIAARKGYRRVVGWEVNGGFLTQTDLDINSKTLKALPTRDAVLPLLGALVYAIKQNKTLAELIDSLPQRYASASKIRKFPRAIGQQIINSLLPQDREIIKVEFAEKQLKVLYNNNQEKILAISEDPAKRLLNIKRMLEKKYFVPCGLNEKIRWLRYINGVRIALTSGDIIHFRPSGNSDEFRCYSNAGTPERAQEIVSIGLSKIIPQMVDKFPITATPSKG